MKPKITRRLSALLCALLVSAVAGIAYLGGRELIEIPQELWWIQVTGYGALGFLGLSILVTPFQRLALRLRPGSIKLANIAAWRRSLGIASAWMALGHAGISMNTYLDWSWETVFETSFLRAGLVGLAILSALLLTSFPWLVKRLHIGFWKQLHRLSYVAAIFVFQHALLSSFAPRLWVIAIFGTLLLLSLLRFIPPQRRAAADSDSRIESPTT